MKQVLASDAFRRFADALEGIECVALRGRPKADLIRVLDALGKYAAMMGTDLRLIQTMDSQGMFKFKGFAERLVNRDLTDEVRRFADMLDKKGDLIRTLDPGYARLTSAIKAVRLVAGSLGIDVGLGGTFAVTPEGIKYGKN